MSEGVGWVGMSVKHVDGREGAIKREYVGFCHVGLTIVDNNGKIDTVQLNSNGPDTGSTGWSWMMGRNGEPKDWAWLGDHNLAVAV